MIAYLCAIGIVALIYCLLALGLNLQFGLTRLVNFGVVAFFAVGAYTSGLLALQGVPLVLCFVAAGLLAGVLALPIGLLSLRLRDDYLAIVTLGFSEAVRISIQQESWLTKGVQGLPGLPKLFASWGSGVSDVAIFATLLALVALVAWGTVRLAASPFGRLLKAIGDDEAALSALGKDPAWFKVQVFMLGAVLAGVLALPIGLLSLRLRDDYLAIVTLGFSEAVRISIQQESWLTKGVQGLPGLPKLFASWGSGVSDMAIFATLLALVALVAWGTVRLAASPFGRLLKAIGDDEAALSALGKDPAWF